MKRTATAQLEEHRKRRRAREREISRRLRGLGAAGALDLLAALCDRWKLRDQGRHMTFEDQTMCMFQQFGLDYRDNMLDALDVDRGSYGLRALDDAINDAELEAIGLYHRLHELDLLPEVRPGAGGEDEDPDPEPGPAGDADEEVDPEKRDALRRIVKVLEMIFYAKRVVLSAFQAKLAVHQLHVDDGTLDLASDLDARLGSWALRFRFIEKTNALQNLLLFLLDGAMEKRYRKSNGWMHEPIYVDGQSMHAWRPVCEIKDFVFSMLRKETAWEQWCNATASGMKNVSSAIDYLTNCHDYQLPELHKQQGVYSFRNGVYLCEADAFHPAGDASLSEDVVACKYFDLDFEDHDCPWRDIPTPHLHGILAHQEFEPEVCDWMYVLLGRLLYPLNKVDSWQVIPFFHGVGSSGKSTIILKVCKGFYEALDVGVLSNNIEKKFGLSAFWNKKIFIAPEIKNDLACEQAEFQSVVSGEEVAIAQKHKTAFSTQWAVPGVLAGNEIPSWSDNSGSIQRRIIMFDFHKVVLHGDMKLGDKLDAEMPRIIAKCNRAYLEFARAHSEVNVWTILPRYFQRTRQMLAQCVNSLEAFLASDEIVLGRDLLCPMEDFRSALKAYEIAHNMKSKRMDADFFRGPMGKYGFRVERAKKAYRGQTRLREYIFGLDLNNMQLGDEDAELS